MHLFGLFLSWSRPSREQQKYCVDNCGPYNNDPSYYLISESHKPVTHKHAGNEEIERMLSANGFMLNRERVLLGSGSKTYQLAKNALYNWSQFQLEWAFVDSKTPVKVGTKFCICINGGISWIMIPCEIGYVSDDDYTLSSATKDGNIKASFVFGTLSFHGNLLAGEERFSLDLDEDDNVWFEIFSFSKPAHFVSVILRPYVRANQRAFVKHSTVSLLKYIKAQQQLSE